MKNFDDDSRTDLKARFGPMLRGARRDGQQCPPAGALSDLAAGRAWPWRRRHLVEHLSHCSDCADDYRVLTAARDGLVGALERHAHAGGRSAVRWLQPGLAAAAALIVVAFSVSVLVQTGDHRPAAEQGMLFASQFEGAVQQVEPRPGRDNLFTSDFGEPEGEGGRLFRDDFGG